MELMMQALSTSLPSQTRWTPASTASLKASGALRAESRAPVITRGAVDLSHAATEVTFEQNQTIYFEFDPAEYCYRVLTGIVRICKQTEDGRRQIAAFPSRGDLFGWNGDRHYAYSAEAATDVVLLRWPRQMIERAIASDPEAGHRLLSILFDQLGEAQKHLLLLGRMTASERVANFLLDRADHYERDGMPSDRIPFRICRRDVGDYLGLSMETVSRTMNALRRRGLIDFTASESIRIRNRQELEEIAHGFDA